MHIWVDLANSPHVPFFRAIVDELTRRGHTTEISARRFAQTVELAEQAGLKADIVGEHGGAELPGKFSNLFARARELRRWTQTQGQRFDLAVSHNSYAQIVAARSLRIKTVTLMDYEHQPANHLAFRLASRVIVPASFPAGALRRCGARRVARYDGIKEDVYLAGFVADESFPAVLHRALGVSAENVLVVVRPPASEALYHRFENELFEELLGRIAEEQNVKALMLARTPAQRNALRAKYAARAQFIFPETALDGANLIAAADLVISAGGTMNREAAALGTPAATIYAGRWAAVDEQLVRENRLTRIATRDDLRGLRFEKKNASAVRRTNGDVRAQVVDLILRQSTEY